MTHASKPHPEVDMPLTSGVIRDSRRKEEQGSEKADLLGLVESAQQKACRQHNIVRQV